MSRDTFKKQITNKELIDQISPVNQKLIKLFLKDKDRKCSDETIKGYTSDLNIFFCWNILENKNKFYPDIKKFELSEFFSYCIDELQWKGKRFSRMKSVLSGLSDTVIKYYDEDYPTFRNFVNSVIDSIPKPAVREKTILEDEDVEIIFNYLKENKLTQEACFFALSIFSGCRISELEQFTIDLIDENKTSFGGVMLETTRKLRCKGFGKEGHVIHKNIIKDLFLPYYYEWIEERQKLIEKTNSTTDALFLKTNGEQATQNVFRSWLEKIGKIVDKIIYPHALRHFTVTYLSRLNLSSDYIVAIMGWKDAKMFHTYNDQEEKDREWIDSEKLQQLIQREKELDNID
jgi:integrase